MKICMKNSDNKSNSNISQRRKNARDILEELTLDVL